MRLPVWASASANRSGVPCVSQVQPETMIASRILKSFNLPATGHHHRVGRSAPIYRVWVRSQRLAEFKELTPLPAGCPFEGPPAFAVLVALGSGPGPAFGLHRSRAN